MRKKRTSISIVLAVLASLAFGSIALADDGLDALIVGSDDSGLSGQVNVTWNGSGNVWGHVVDVNHGETKFETGGSSIFGSFEFSTGFSTRLIATCSGSYTLMNSTAWNDEGVGGHHRFEGRGDFTVDMSTRSGGRSGAELASSIKAESSSGASLYAYGMKHFGVTYAWGEENQSGFVELAVSGSDYAKLWAWLGPNYFYERDLKTHPIEPAWVPNMEARGEYDIFQHCWSQDKNGNTFAEGIIEISGIGTASSHYGYAFHSRDTCFEMNMNGGYKLPVTATGLGKYYQYGYGANSLNFNGISMPGGGSAEIIANFVNGFSLVPNMSGE